MVDTLLIEPGRMLIAGKFDSERDHLRLGTGDLLISLANVVTSTVTSGSTAPAAVGMFYLDGVESIWDKYVANPSYVHDLSGETFEAGV
jgi:hypothetical protein